MLKMSGESLQALGGAGKRARHAREEGLSALGRDVLSFDFLIFFGVFGGKGFFKWTGWWLLREARTTRLVFLMVFMQVLGDKSVLQ